MRRLAITLVAILFACPAYSQEWGDLTIRFVYDGEPPKPRALEIRQDRKVCKEGELFDKSLLVNIKDRGVANVVIWLAQAKGEAPAPVHAAYEDSAKSEVTLIAKNCRFNPHVAIVRRPQTLVVANSDPIGHNFHGSLYESDSFNVLLPAGEKRTINFKAPADEPVRIGCGIHPWISAWMVLRDNPYMALSDSSGKLKISKLPAGKWTFRLWHERKGFIRQFTKGGKSVHVPREGWTLEIRPGANDLGDVLLKPEDLK